MKCYSTYIVVYCLVMDEM